MESWNIYSQNAPSTPSSAWLCPQNNTPGPEWLHSQNNSNERERNENTAALATPTRYIMEYNDVNQNSTSGSFYNPYAQEMERLFDNNFLKIGNPEDLLNSNDMYNNENLSWLNSNENIIPVTTASNISNIMTTTTTTAPSNIPTTTNVANSPTPSLVTDDDQDQLYNNNEVPTTTTASFIQYPITANTTNTSTKSSSSSTSPISPRVVKSITATTTAANFYQPNLRQDQYVQSKKHDPKQLLLPLSTNTNSIDGTMTVSMTSPTSSLFTDDDLDSCDQTKTKGRRQSYYQDFPLSISTNDLPMQQPSPASSEFSSGVKTPPPCNETTSKQKKRKVSQRKLNNNRRTSKVEGSLISPVDESYLEQNEQTSANISDDLSDTEETCSITKDTSVSSIDSNSSDSSTKRELPDDGHDETPEEKRARLLERNRIAAAKCRQKKKQAQECLQQQASDLTQKNTTMHTLVNDLREEALKLKNQLLAHSTCNCNVIQEYVRTSGQFAFARPPYTK